MLRKRSGPMTSTACPAASTPRMVLRSVITTPLTCGAHASVASSMRNRDLLFRGRCDRCSGQGLDFLPAQDRQLSVGVLDQCGQTFDPVAIVAIQNPADRTDLRLV